MMSNLYDILVTCIFNFVPCNSSQFEFIYHPLYHNCYRFNSGFDAQHRATPLITVLTSGLVSGLTLDLYAGLTDSQNYENNTVARGFRVFVQNSSEYPYSYGMKPYILTPGLQNTFSVARTFYKQYNEWPYRYSECAIDESGELLVPLTDRSLYELILQTNYSYTRFVCQVSCFQYNLIDECQCVDYNGPGASKKKNFTSDQYCQSDEQQACEQNYFNDKFIQYDYYKSTCLEK